MKLRSTTLVFLAALFCSPSEISMGGLKIGDSQKSLSNIKLKVETRDGDMIKFRTENSNDFSVTCENGKIVFMENDWRQDPDARQPLFSDFQFGKTSLRDIRTRFGTNGFTYTSRGSFTTKTDLITFNCFEFDAPNKEILVVLTKAPRSAKVTQDDVADHLKLDAIIIADKSYCDREWGEEKVYDKNYKKIAP